MTQGDHVDEAPSGYQPGDAVWVFVLGAWQPAVVIDMVDAGRVLARYHRGDGKVAERAFPRSSVVVSDAS